MKKVNVETLTNMKKDKVTEVLLKLTADRNGGGVYVIYIAFDVTGRFFVNTDRAGDGFDYSLHYGKLDFHTLCNANRAAAQRIFESLLAIAVSEAAYRIEDRCGEIEAIVVPDDYFDTCMRACAHGF